MIGAHKLNERDVERIRELISQGINDCKIAREFIPESGRMISREMVQAIRSKRRWNSDIRSFIMKDEMENDFLESSINGIKYRTEIVFIKSKSVEEWGLFFFKEGIRQNMNPHSYFKKYPRKSKILELHLSFIESYS